MPWTKYRLINITWVISKLTGMKSRNLPGNIKDLRFSLGLSELYDIHWGVQKSKHCSPGSDFRNVILSGELSEVDSAGAQRHDVDNF